MTLTSVFSTATTSIPILPFVHTTISKNFWNIFEDLEFQASLKCDILKDYYSFFYYGRAAYRPNPSKDKRGPTHELCVFVIDPNEFSSQIGPSRGLRIHPFDTGAFQRYCMDLGWTDIDLPEFELPARLSVCPDVMNLFWPDSKSYIECDVNRLLTKAASHHDDSVVRYHELLRRSIGGEIDDRCGSIEVAVHTPDVAPLKIPISGLKGVVVPHRFLDSPKLSSSMNQAGFRVVTYPTYQWATPNQRFMEVMALAREIIGL